jgi:hypothetical protein
MELICTVCQIGWGATFLLAIDSVYMSESLSAVIVKQFVLELKSIMTFIPAAE